MSETPNKPPASNPRDILYQIDDGIIGELGGQIRECDKQVEAARRALATAEKNRDFVAGKIAKLHGLLGNPQLRKSIAAQPHDGALIALLKTAKGVPWAKLKQDGATDAEISDELRKGWPQWGGENRPNRAHGGDQPRVWIDAPGYGAEPTFAGKELVEQTRRVMEIPLPVKPDKVTRGQGDKVKNNAGGKPAKKPAAPSGKKPQSALAANKPAAKKPVAKPAASKVFTGGIPGAEYPAADVGLTYESLEAAMSPDLRPRDGQGDGGRIGAPIVDEHCRYWAVIGAAHGGGKIRYTLARVAPRPNWKGPEPKTWSQRRQQHPSSAPEEVPLEFLAVDDPTGGQWVITDLEGVDVVVPITPAIRQAMAAEAKKRLAGSKTPGSELGDDDVEAILRSLAELPPEKLVREMVEELHGADEIAELLDRKLLVTIFGGSRVDVSSIGRDWLRARAGNASADKAPAGEKIDLGLSKPSAAAIYVSEDDDGRHRAGYEYRVASSGASAGPPDNTPGFATQAQAVGDAARRMLQGIQAGAAHDDSAKEKSARTSAANIVRGFIEELVECNPILRADEKPGGDYDPSHPWYWKLGGKPPAVADIGIAKNRTLEEELKYDKLPKDPAKREKRLRTLLTEAENRMAAAAKDYADAIEDESAVIGKVDRDDDCKPVFSGLAATLIGVINAKTRLAAIRSALGMPALPAAAEAEKATPPSAPADGDFDDQAIDQASSEALADRPGTLNIGVARRISGRWAFCCHAIITKDSLHREMFQGNFPTREEAVAAACDVVDEFVKPIRAKSKAGTPRRRICEEIRRELDRLDKSLGAQNAEPEPAELATPFPVGQRVKITDDPGIEAPDGPRGRIGTIISYTQIGNEPWMATVAWDRDNEKQSIAPSELVAATDETSGIPYRVVGMPHSPKLAGGAIAMAELDETLEAQEILAACEPLPPEPTGKGGKRKPGQLESIAWILDWPYWCCGQEFSQTGRETVEVVPLYTLEEWGQRATHLSRGDRRPDVHTHEGHRLTDSHGRDYVIGPESESISIEVTAGEKADDDLTDPPAAKPKPAAIHSKPNGLAAAPKRMPEHLHA